MTSPSSAGTTGAATATRFKRIQHVSIARPDRPGGRDEAKHFWGDIMGLPEVPVPGSLAPELIWFNIGDDELHVLVEKDRPTPGGQHLCLEVPTEADLHALRARLDAAGIKTDDSTPIKGRPRFFTSDPFGNRVELTTIVGDYR